MGGKKFVMVKTDYSVKKKSQKSGQWFTVVTEKNIKEEARGN